MVVTHKKKVEEKRARRLTQAIRRAAQDHKGDAEFALRKLLRRVLDHQERKRAA